MAAGGSGMFVDDQGVQLLAWAGHRGIGQREAVWILEHVDRRDDRPRGPDHRAECFRTLVERCAGGEPLQYVLGRWAFRSLDLDVDPRVLIPRPETEQVVEVALSELEQTVARSGRSAAQPVRCVDLGTGSGAIALALATECSRLTAQVEIWATDSSGDALEVAEGNLARLAGSIAAAGSQVRLRMGWWFAALPAEMAGQVDLIVANPPYVAASELAGLDPQVRDWEPYTALVASTGASGVGGTADIEVIVAGARRWLRPGGTLVVEIAPHQAYASIDAARRAGYARVRSERDLAGRLRMLVAGR